MSTINSNFVSERVGGRAIGTRYGVDWQVPYLAGPVFELPLKLMETPKPVIRVDADTYFPEDRLPSHLDNCIVEAHKKIAYYVV